MFGTNFRSLANPVAGAAAFDNGIKSTSSFMTYSVGTAGSTIYDYVSKPSGGSDVTVVVSSGVIKFSYPQSHSYIGVGDKVIYTEEVLGVVTSRTVYLNEKISPTEWRVFKEVGVSPNIYSSLPMDTVAGADGVLVSITKAFNTITTAVDYINVSVYKDLVEKQTVLRIACYNMADSSTTALTTSYLFNTSESYYVKIFAPNNIRTECNLSQRHTNPGPGYVVTFPTTDGFVLNNDFDEIDGLRIVCTAINTYQVIIGWKTSSSDLRGIKITNNLISGVGGKGIIGNNSAKCYIVSNILFGNAAIYGSLSLLGIYNNTMIGGSIDIGSKASDVCNCLLTGTATIVFSGIVATINNCVFEISAVPAGVQNCIGEYVAFFKDAGTNDYTFDQRCSLSDSYGDVIIRGGIDIVFYGKYPLYKDIAGNKIDDTWHVGAYHHVRELKFSVGNPKSSDLKGTGTCLGITNGLFEFSSNDYDPKVSPGCVVTLADGSAYTLFSKIDGTHWYVTDYHDAGGASNPMGYGNINMSTVQAITSIKVNYSTLYEALVLQSGGRPGILNDADPWCGYWDFSIIIDRKVTVYCVYGIDDSVVSEPVGDHALFDETRNLTIQTFDSVTTRHGGKFDSNLYYMAPATKVIPFDSFFSHLVLDGLQFTGASRAVNIRNESRNVTIKNNLVKDSNFGICYADIVNYGSSVDIVGNIVYNCSVAGIDIRDDINPLCIDKDFESRVNVYNNTVAGNLRGISMLLYDNRKFTCIVSLKNNLESGSTEVGYYSTAHNPDRVTAYSNWCSDTSIEKFFGNWNISNASATFIDPRTNDYRINFATSINMVNTQILNAYGYTDLIVNSYGETDVGAIQFKYSQYVAVGELDDRVINFSIGKSAALHTDYSNLYITIKGSVLRFIDQFGQPVEMGDKIGIGDRVTAGDNIIILSEKGSNNVWLASSEDGYGYTYSWYDLASTHVTDISRQATSLKDAFDDDALHDFPGIGTYDISGMVDANILVWCYDDADDTDAATIAGWTTDQAHRIVIQTPWNIESQCNSRQRHAGIDGPGYKVKVSTSALSAAILLNNTFVDVIGLIVDGVDSVGDAIRTGVDAGENQIQGNIIFNAANGIVQYSVNPSVILARTNIVYDCGVGIKIFDAYVSNNTVINCTTCGIDFSGAISGDNIVNNIVHSDTEPPACYSGTGPVSCISSDDTGSATFRNVDIAFADKDNNDFHIDRSNWLAINNGIDLHVHYLSLDVLPYDYGIDTNKISLLWSIGADCPTSLDVVDLYFSVGVDTSDFQSKLDVDLRITILDGFATFSCPQTSSQFGVGNKVTYNTINTCYIYRKVSSTVWEIRDERGLMVSNIENAVVNSIKHPFNDLSKTFVAPAGELSVAVLMASNMQGFPLATEHTFSNLANARCRINIPVYKNSSEFVNGVTISSANYTSDSECFFKVYTPFDVRNECVENQRHLGYYDSTHDSAKIFNTGSPASAISVALDYTVIEGLVIKPASGGYGVVITGSRDSVRVDGCIIMNATKGIYTQSTSTRGIFVNNIIYDCSKEGILTGGNDSVYNNTVVSCGTGSGAAAFGIKTSATDSVFNNIVRGPTVKTYYAGDYSTGYSIIRNCISSDSSLDNIETCISGMPLTFAGNSRKDNSGYALADNTDGVAKSSGKQLTHNNPNPYFYETEGYSPRYTFNYDATGKPRDHRWDIGALEYKPRKVVYSVGPAGDLKTTSLTYLRFDISYNSADESIITFYNDNGEENPQTNPGIGIGCEVTDTSYRLPSDGGCLLKEKISQSTWVVTTYAGLPVELDPYFVDSTKTIAEISHPFNYLWDAANSDSYISIWENSYRGIGTTDLVSQLLRVDLACYQGTSEAMSLFITGLTTNRDCRLRIYTPYDDVNEVNISQRHAGNASGGYIFNPGHSNTTSSASIHIDACDYSVVEGLVVTTNSGDIPDCIIFSRTHGFEIIGNIICNCPGFGINAITADDGYLGEIDDFIINNLVYNCGKDGIRTGAAVSFTNPQLTHVLNNTVYNCLRGIYFNTSMQSYTGSLLSSDSAKAVIINNLCQRSRFEDIVIENDYVTRFYNWAELAHNITSDSSEADLEGTRLSYHNTEILFDNTESEIFELNHVTDYAALDTGVDLSGYPKYAFSNDIALRERNVTTWEIGAFEYLPVMGTGNLNILPIVVSSENIISSTAPTLEIHLRASLDDYLVGVSPSLQFLKVCDGGAIDDKYGINNYLDTYPELDSYNIVINVQGGRIFESNGGFILRDRGTRTVEIITYPPEAKLGPASIMYDYPITDDDSVQKLLTFRGMKIYSDSTHPSNAFWLLGIYSKTRAIRCINCIVHVNRDALVANACVASIYNSIIVYSNILGSTQAVLVGEVNSVGNIISNSMVLVNSNFDVSFFTSLLGQTASVKEIYNTLSYNYDGVKTFDIVGASPTDLPNTDPLLDSVGDPTLSSDVPINSYKLTSESPAINAGNNSIIKSTYDIVGNDRVFSNGFVDIGPYEIQLQMIVFTAKDISSIYQDKLTQNNNKPEYIALNKKVILFGIHSQFDSRPSYRNEFFRESKIIMELNIPYSKYKLYTDKVDVVVKEFEAYYDYSIKGIVISKDSAFDGNLFSKIFGDERFVFSFDEVSHKLTVSINSTFNKGAAGSKNPIKNVKFGGSSVIIK